MAVVSSILNIGEKVIPKPQKMVQTQSTPDDKKVIQQIVSTHSADANYAVEEKALLSMAQDILSQATPTLSLDPKSDSKVAVDKTQEGITDELAFTIHKIGCELSCDCSGGGE